MKYFEYRLTCLQAGTVVEDTRYTLAEDDDHAIKNFKSIVPLGDDRQWVLLERFCPYANKWMVLNISNIQQNTLHGSITDIS